MSVLVFSLYLSKFANSLFPYLKGRNFVIISCFGINYCGTCFCDFGPKSQKLNPQNTVLDKSIARISSAKYGFRANRKNKFHITKNFYIF